MSIDRVRAQFQQLGMEERILEFAVSSATVELAAEAVGVPAAQIAKTLSFRAGEAGCRLVVAAGDARVDNRRYKDAFHEKARFLTPEEAVALTGHAVGGVCPFALPAGVEVYLDESLRRFDTVYPAAGSSPARNWSAVPARTAGSTCVRAGGQTNNPEQGHGWMRPASKGKRGAFLMFFR